MGSRCVSWYFMRPLFVPLFDFLLATKRSQLVGFSFTDTYEGKRLGLLRDK